MTSVDLRAEIEEVVPFLFGNDEHLLEILHSYSEIEFEAYVRKCRMLDNIEDTRSGSKITSEACHKGQPTY